MRTDLLFEHLDALVTTPQDVAQLEAAILQLAVQGKLVPQDPDDEPASELLERIRVEKEQLPREGKIKASKAIPAVQDSEILPKLPSGWVWARPMELGEVCGGGTPSKKESRYWGGDVVWISPKDMKRDIVADSQLKITREALEHSSANLIPAGSVLIVARSGILKRKLPVSINSVDCAVNQDLKVIVPYVAEINRYIQLMLKGYESFILRKLVKQGTTVQSLKYREFEVQPFPFPPLAEQKRIVAKVDQLLAQTRALAARLEQVDSVLVPTARAAFQALLDVPDAAAQRAAWQRVAEHFDMLTSDPRAIETLKQTILQLAVQGKLVPQDPDDEPAGVLVGRVKAGDTQLVQQGKRKNKPLQPVSSDQVPHELPKGWAWARLGGIARFLGGYAFRSHLYVDYSGNQLIRLGNVKNDLILLDVKPTFISDEVASEREKWRLFKDDLLITMTGTRDKRDYCFTTLVREENLADKRLYLNQRVGCLRVKRPILSRLVNLFLKADSVLDTLFETETGTANQGNIGAGAIRNALFPLPPLAEQKRIVAKVESLLALCDELAARVAGAEEVRGRLLRAVLNGE